VADRAQIGRGGRAADHLLRRRRHLYAAYVKGQMAVGGGWRHDRAGVALLTTMWLNRHNGFALNAN